MRRQTCYHEKPDSLPFEWSKVRYGSQVEADVIEEQHAEGISADLPMEHAD